MECAAVGISEWPVGERPRERLLEQGAGCLSDAELLAVLLQTGASGLTALDLGRQLLARYGDLAGVMAAELCDLEQQPGMGPAKAARLVAVRELAVRQQWSKTTRRDVLTSSAATREYLRLRYRHNQREIFSCLFLNNQHHVVKLEELFAGTIDGAAVYPREVVKRCLYHNAAAVIFAHNHPSGVAEPSQADIAITSKLRSALGTIEVRVLDHLVIGSESVVSMAERDLL